MSTTPHEAFLPPTMLKTDGTPDVQGIPATPDGRLDVRKLNSTQRTGYMVAANRSVIMQPEMLVNLRAEARRMMEAGTPPGDVVVAIWSKTHPLTQHFGFDIKIKPPYAALVSGVTRQRLAAELAGHDEEHESTAHFKMVAELLGDPPEPGWFRVACFYDGGQLEKAPLEPVYATPEATETPEDARG